MLQPFLNPKTNAEIEKKSIADILYVENLKGRSVSALAVKYNLSVPQVVSILQKTLIEKRAEKHLLNVTPIEEKINKLQHIEDCIWQDIESVERFGLPAPVVNVPLYKLLLQITDTMTDCKQQIQESDIDSVIAKIQNNNNILNELRNAEAI